MSTSIATTPTPPVEAESTAPAKPAATERRAFERWGVVAYLAAVVLMVLSVLVWLDGVLVYVLDDPAIHLGIADTLVEHGTWGVTAGDFQSASSSPLWTVLIAAGIAAAPVGDEWVPLLLNVAAGLAVVIVFGRSQTLLSPGWSRERRFDAFATLFLVGVALFLPGLTLVGMEHTLHVVLVLAAVVAIDRQQLGDRGRWVQRAPYVLLVLATLTRFETVFVGVGLAIGLACADGWSRQHLWERRRQIVGLVAAVGVPLVAFALWNRAMGGGFLPNSVLAKGQGVGVHSSSTGMTPDDITKRLRSDPLVVALVSVTIVYVIATWGRVARHRVVAIGFIVATLLHVAFADVGWYQRYQAYLLAIGLYLVLRLVAELPIDFRRRALGALLVIAVLLTAPKVTLLVKTPLSSDDMYRHQYQAGRFLGRYYDGRPIATDQLGYVSWFHDGPLTDLAGLGDYEVLERMPDGRSDRPKLWKALAEERGFPVVVTFADTVGFYAAENWIYVGQFCKDKGSVANGFSRCFAFWATEPDEVAPLRDNLLDFEADLPDRTFLELNDFADWQADIIRAEEELEALQPEE